MSRANKKMIFGYIRRKRIKYAFKMGKLEHRAGRVLGLYLLILAVLAWHIPIYYTRGFIAGAFLIWIVYIGAHTLEKKLFGHHGPRSKWKK